MLYRSDSVSAARVSNNAVGVPLGWEPHSPPILGKVVRTVRAELLLPADAHSHFTVLWLSAAQPRARQSIRWWDERMVGMAGIWGEVSICKLGGGQAEAESNPYTFQG